MSVLAKLVIVPALLALVKSEFPFELDEDLEFQPPITRSNDPNSYRLPDEFDPTHCDIEVTPYFETAPAGKEPFTFDGEAIHYLKVSLYNMEIWYIIWKLQLT